MHHRFHPYRFRRSRFKNLCHFFCRGIDCSLGANLYLFRDMHEVRGTSALCYLALVLAPDFRVLQAVDMPSLDRAAACCDFRRATWAVHENRTVVRVNTLQSRVGRVAAMSPRCA